MDGRRISQQSPYCRIVPVLVVSSAGRRQCRYASIPLKSSRPFGNRAGQDSPAGVSSMMDGHDSNERCAIGPESLGRLFDRYAAALELYARQLCGCSEDVVQEALIELARQSRPPDDAVAWLYRVVRNKAISALRSSRRRRHHETEAAGHRSLWFEGSPSDLVDASAAADALESLPIEQREVVVARVWGGLSFQQIGQLVGASDSAAHRRYEAALSALRRKLRVPCPKND
jgi:RNA polymerase sigma factor (sigma-70 family)